RVTIDPAARAGIYKEVQQRIYDEAHDVVLWFRNGSIGAQPSVGGLDTIVHPNGSNLKFHKVWLPAGSRAGGVERAQAAPSSRWAADGRHMTYILNRLLSIALTLFLISIITFAVTTILPGDVATKIKASSLIVVMTMAIAAVCAVPLGVWAAVHRNRWQDAFSSSAALVGVSLPDFFWGIMMILLFARVLGWFPSSGFADPAVALLPALSHAFLPSFALGLGLMAHLTRMTRSTMTGILGQEFIRVGRAKGLAERTIVWRH